MEPPSSTRPRASRISVINRSAKRISAAPIRRAVHLALNAHSSSDASVCILLTNDQEVQELNQRYRNVDEPTDVLTFPAVDFPGGPLGDIAIAVPYAERQAEARGTSLEAELQYLAIHGALHLLGYDDISDADREAMMAEMNRIGAMAGLPAEPAWTSILHAEPGL